VALMRLRVTGNHTVRDQRQQLKTSRFHGGKADQGVTAVLRCKWVSTIRTSKPVWPLTKVLVE
jgi:hypothetical protein